MTITMTSPDSERFIAAVNQRLVEIFLAYQKGYDVSTAQLFRSEGFISAGCELGFYDQSQAREMIKLQWQTHLDQPWPESAEQDIHIPVAMHRAPVFPSKS
jgi:hypothetical protein